MTEFVVSTNLWLTRYEEQRRAYLRGGNKGWLSSNHDFKVNIIVFSLKTWIGASQNVHHTHMTCARLSVPQTSFNYGLNQTNYPPSGILGVNVNGNVGAKKKREACLMRHLCLMRQFCNSGGRKKWRFHWSKFDILSVNSYWETYYATKKFP